MVCGRWTTLLVIADVQASPPPRASPATPDPWRATPRDFHHGLLALHFSCPSTASAKPSTERSEEILRSDGVVLRRPPRRTARVRLRGPRSRRLVRPALGSPIRRKEQERGFLGGLLGEHGGAPFPQKSPHTSVSPPSRRLPAGSRRYFPEEPSFLGRPALVPFDTRVLVTSRDEKCRLLDRCPFVAGC